MKVLKDTTMKKDHTPYRYAGQLQEAYDFWKDRTDEEFFFKEWSFEEFDEDIYEQHCSSQVFRYT